MNSDATVRAFQNRIAALAAERIGRALTDQESRFITSRGGFLALEAILDTVRDSSPTDVERYLNSESAGPATT